MSPNYLTLLQNTDWPKEISKQEIPSVIGLLEVARAQLWARLMEHVGTSQKTNGNEPDRLLTVEEAAERLRFTRQYLYDLIRKKQFPHIRQGKYLRISLSDLSTWIGEHRENGLDGEVYRSYNISNERKGTAPDPKIARAYSRGDGGSNRRQAKHGRPLGARRVEDFRARVQTHPSAGKDEIESEEG